MDAAFCVKAVEDALARHCKPEIFNQGSQFTRREFTGLLIQLGVAICMDGKGTWRDNVFVERLWRSVKCEEVYLRANASVSEVRSSIGRYLTFYNTRRPHQSLGRRTPSNLLPAPATNPGGGMKPAEIRLSTGREVFRQTEPVLWLCGSFAKGSFEMMA